MILTKIRIKFLTEQATKTFKHNIEKAYTIIKNNPKNNEWIHSFLPENPFEEKIYEIDDFKLKYSDNYDDVSYENAILIYENLKHLPRRILSEERFWLWLYLDKFYNIATKAIKVEKVSTLKNHWTHALGNRRGLAFGVLSREFFRVDLSVDKNLEDKYELTKYIFQRIERFRTLSWRTFSNNKTIVLGTLKAQRDFEEKSNKKLNNSHYNLVSKRISRYASVNFLDNMAEKEVYYLVYNYLEELRDEE